MSIRLTPASRAARQIAAEVASSASPPNAIAPSAMLETLTPVAPSSLIARPASSHGDSSVERGLDAVEHLLLGGRHLAEAEDPAGRGRDQLGEPDDLVLEQPVLLVVELRRQRLDVGLPCGEQLVAGLALEPGLEQLV